MIYNFDTKNESYALSALIIYVIYRSRNMQRFKISTDMWDRITRFTQAAAKRSKTIQDFISKFSKKMDCDAINPKWMAVASDPNALLQVGNSFIEFNEEKMRSFITSEIESKPAKEIIDCYKKNTQFIILLVRERLEREKPIEKKLIKGIEDE